MITQLCEAKIKQLKYFTSNSMPPYREFLQQGKNLLPHVSFIVTTFKIGWQDRKGFIVDIKA
jgi:hypothetical protein